jgi:ubiquinone biosynthesis protein COQ9
VPGTEGGPSDAGAKIWDVTDLTRSERTSRLLVARLDALASVASQISHADAERLVELASIATMHAVALETLQAEKAEAIWREAHERHPELPQVEIELPARLAA